jgi:hypothetical protein
MARRALGPARRRSLTDVADAVCDVTGDVIRERAWTLTRPD